MLLLARVFALLVAVEIASPCLWAQQTTPSSVRSTDSRVLELLARGYDRSPTFRRLVDQLNGSDIIVYVQVDSRIPPPVNGYLSFAGATQRCRYLRILINPRNNTDKLVALIGHELQHANEVAGHAAVRDERSLAAMYRQIGIENADGWDTAAARATGPAVEREVAASVDVADVRSPGTGPLRGSPFMSRKQRVGSNE